MAEKLVKDSQCLVKDLANDCISRKAAIDAIKKCRNESDMPDMWYDGMSCALRCIYQLPSAQPETHDKHTETHACDCISRQALCEYALNQKDKNITANDIMRFPSAQPKSYRQGYQAGYKDAQPERKRGRWITLWRLDVLDGYQCSACKAWSRFKFNFCRNCGADMRGEQE